MDTLKPVTKPTYQVGQEVWVLDTQRIRHPNASTPLHKATISAIGRKWATIGRKERFDITNGQLDGGEYTSPGRVFLSPEAFQQEVRLNAAWSALGDAVRRHQPPTGVTAEFLEEVVCRLQG